MHSPARQRNARATGRHRLVGEPDRASLSTFPIDTNQGTATTAAHGASTYARHVGRIGALAIALGVGAALATSGALGVARADDGSDSSSGAGSNSESSSGSTASGDSPATSAPTEESDVTQQTTSGQSGSAGGGSVPRPTVPDMNFSNTGGAHTSTNQSAAPTSPTTNDDTGDGNAEVIVDVNSPKVTSPADDAERSSAPPARSKSPAKQSDSSVRPPTPTGTPPATHSSDRATKAADQQPSVAAQPSAVTPVDAPAVATGLAPIPEVIPPATSELPIEERSVATMLAAAIAPFLLPGPNAPAASPLLWAVMAWTRREAEQTVATPTAARAAEVPTAALAAADHEFVTLEGVPLTGTLPNLPLLDLLGQFQIDEQPANGTVTVGLLGDFVYVPNPKFHGVDSFTYVGLGLLGLPTTVASVTITVLPVNDAPVAANYNLYTSHDRPLIVRVLDDAVDADGDALTSAILTQPGSGTVVQNPDGSLVYSPDAGFAGDDLFTYTITDPSGMRSTGVIWITVRANQSPISTLQNLYVMTRDGKLVVSADDGVLVDDYDPDGDPVTVVSFGTPSYGTVTWTQDGSFTYTPMAGFTGYDQFTYVLSDSVGATAVGHVMVVIEAPPNQPPVVETAVTLVTEEDVDATFDPLKGAKDPDGDLLYARVEGQPKYGFAQQFYDDGGELGGHIAYVPDRGFVGTDEFTYRVFDAYNNYVEVTVTVVVGPSTRPTAVDDEVSVAEGGKVTIDVLKNDLSPRGDSLQIDVLAPAVYGTLEYNERTRTFVYTPTEGANRTTDSFLYEVTDKDGRTSMATATIHIKLADDGPEARDDWAATPVNTTAVINVLENDYTPGEKPPTVRIDRQPEYGGKAFVRGDGTIEFTPDKDFTGTVELGYSVTDPQGNVSHATVTIEVYGGGENPKDKWYTVGKDRTLTVAVPDGLLSGLDSDGWSIGIEVKPRNGTLSLNQNGSFSYTPNKGFVGKDTFDFYTHTSEWGDGPFTVTIEVTEAATEPNPEANYGTTIALEASSAFGTCGDNLMPGQGAPAEVWPTCLFTTAVRKPSDPW